MARYFGGFRDRLLKKGRSSPLSDRDVDWVKVSGTVIWSPEKRNYEWLDPETYLSSFLGDAPEPQKAVPQEPEAKPIWDLSAFANEAEDDLYAEEEGYQPPSGLFSTAGVANYQPDIEAELPSIEEYKHELLSALRRRGLRVDVRKISLPEDVETELELFHQGDKTIDSHALRARLQLFKKQVIESFDQFSRVGETYIIPHAPRYPDFAGDEASDPAANDPFADAGELESDVAEASFEEPAFDPDFLTEPAAEIEDVVDDGYVRFEDEPEPIESIDSDFESFVLKSLDKLEASMHEAMERPATDSPEDEEAAPRAVPEAERPANERMIYDPVNGTLDVPRKAGDVSPRIRPSTGSADPESPRDHAGVPGFVGARLDGAPSSESWLVSPIQSRKAPSDEKAAGATPPADRPAEAGKATSAGKTDADRRSLRGMDVAPSKPDILKALNTIRSAPADKATTAESVDPAHKAEPDTPKDAGDKKNPSADDPRQQSLSILERLDQQTGDGHASPTHLDDAGDSVEQRPRFPALESITAAMDEGVKASEPAKPASRSRSQSLSDFLLSLKNDNEEQHLAVGKMTAPAAEEKPPAVVSRAPATEEKPPEARPPKPAEEKKRTVGLFAKPERRTPPPEAPPAPVDPLDLPVAPLDLSDVQLESEAFTLQEEAPDRFPAPKTAWVTPTIARETSWLHTDVEDRTPEAAAPEEPEPSRVAPAREAEAQVIPEAPSPPTTEGPDQAAIDRLAEWLDASDRERALDEREDDAAPLAEAPTVETNVTPDETDAPAPTDARSAAPPDDAPEAPLAPSPAYAPRWADAVESEVVESEVVESEVVEPGVVEPETVAQRAAEAVSEADASTDARPKADLAQDATPEASVPESSVPEASVPESSVPESGILASGILASGTEDSVPLAEDSVESPEDGARRVDQEAETMTEETPDPGEVFSEHEAPEPIIEVLPEEEPDEVAPAEKPHNFMANDKAVSEDTDQRHAEKLAQSAREALEALESRDTAETPAPAVAAPPKKAATQTPPGPYEKALDGVVEALAFAADDPIPLVKVSKVFSEVSGERRPTEAQVVESVERLNALYAELRRAFRVKIWAGGIRMATDPSYAEYIRAIYQQERPKKLSRTLMETLAIVAYSQPTTKPEVDFIRGVDSDYAVRKLLELGLIDIVGRSEAIGKPLLYGTSERFLEQFGLSELAALPKLKEIEELLDDPSLQRERMHLLALESGLADEGGAEPQEAEETATENEGDAQADA
ncbi:MAG: SMC-Scp complex subunit ScpB [Rhodothermales bacterium]